MPFFEKNEKNFKKWSWRQDLNLQPEAYKATALPIVLHQHFEILGGTTGLEPAHRKRYMSHNHARIPISPHSP